MAVRWTEEQQKVIQLDERNILVSAAAGSGKTAVLVERILNKMTRPDHPVDIDRLLVVTFTRAAAGEMKERLTEALEKRLQEDPDNEHLQRQQTLIHNAQINTIDGFCAYIIRNYFHTIDLDPGFRTANEGEGKLLRYDAAKELLEANYEAADPRFLRFVEVFATGKKDDGLMDLIWKVYDFAMSNPWPREWLRECAKTYQANTAEELLESPWMEKLWSDVDQAMLQAEQLLMQNERLLKEADGPYVYEEMAAADRLLTDRLQEACGAKDFDRCAQIVSELSFMALSRKKGENISEKKREEWKENRDQWKKVLTNLKARYFYGDLKGILREIELCREPIQELLRLAEEFMDVFSRKKRQRNLVDFSDMEHFALDILVKKQDGELIYTEAADEFSRRFEEILIDEYQDSNLVQETLLQSVSRLRQGSYNLFMVGDVKQSIYRFRLARPELFVKKYETYQQDSGPCQRIDLHKNFRSRQEILAGVNTIFGQLMGKKLGDVEYDPAAALYPGTQFPPYPERSKAANGGKEPVNSEQPERSLAVEVLIGETDTEELSDDPSVNQTALEMEARMIGRRIQELVGRHLLVDKETGEYRPARYQDCVILLRTVSGWAETFSRVLSDMDIPAYATAKTGYFSTTEVVTILNYLRICDNPMQELPFTGVLLSPIVRCTPRELAELKAAFPDCRLYECVWKYRESGEDPTLRKKLDTFLKLYAQVRERVPYTPIHELIQWILKQTGYETCAAAMPGGEQRQANLLMLVEKAMEYESTSYRGLFNFIRYVEQLQKYQVDFGEVSVAGENENTVRIMSIHKSKGLEFPIVFVAGLGKDFNMMDANASLVIHPELGVGMSGIDPQLRLKVPILIRQVIQRQLRIESLGEELRVLYVALTRAKEKLILTGTLGKLDQKLKKLVPLARLSQRKLPYGLLADAQCYWDWILPALARHPAMRPLYWRIGEDELWLPEDLMADLVFFRLADCGPALFSIRTVRAAQLAGEEIGRQIFWEQRFREYREWDCEKVYHPSVRKELDERFSYRYPYEFLQEIPAKISVSELKRKEIGGKIGSLEGEEAQEWIAEEPVIPWIPEFMKEEKEELSGASRGTAYHRFLEHLDYTRVESPSQLWEQMHELKASGRLDQKMAESIRVNQIFWFVSSALGRRIQAAAKRQQLWREQQFVMSIPASEYLEGKNNGESILIQGIIDLFFEEPDGLVLIDYKTDYVEKGKEEELLKKYESQLLYYAKALKRVRRQPVKEIYLYSFAVGKALPVKGNS